MKKAKENIIREVLTKGHKTVNGNYRYSLETHYDGTEIIVKHYWGGYKKELYATTDEVKEIKNKMIQE